MISHDDRDTVIALADERLEQVVDLTVDRDSYRLLALEAIAALHDLTRERDRLRTAHHRLLDEYRLLREQMIGPMEAA